MPLKYQATPRNIVTERDGDCHVCFEGAPTLWARGADEVEAIGKLMVSHGEQIYHIVHRNPPYGTCDGVAREAR